MSNYRQISMISLLNKRTATRPFSCCLSILAATYYITCTSILYPYSLLNKAILRAVPTMHREVQQHAQTAGF